MSANNYSSITAATAVLQRDYPDLTSEVLSRALADALKKESDPHAGDRLLTTAEVADRLRLCRTQVYRIVRAGHLRYMRAGHRTVRVYESSLVDFMRGRDNLRAPRRASPVTI